MEASSTESLIHQSEYSLSYIKAVPSYKRVLSHFALVFTGCSFSLMNVLISVVIKTDNTQILNSIARASFFAWYRLLFSVPILLVASYFIEGTSTWFAFAKISLGEKKKDFILLLACGFLGVFANQFFFSVGVSFVGADTAAIYQPLSPIFTAFFAILSGFERFSYLRVGGVVISVVGVAGILWSAGHKGNKNDTSLHDDKSLQIPGNLFLLVNAMGAASLGLLQKPLLKRYSPIFLTFMNVFVGLFFTSIPATYFYIIAPEYCGITHNEIPVMVYTVVVATSLNYGLLSWANQYVDATIVNLYTTVQPPMTILIAILLAVQKDSVALTSVLYGGVIIIGLFVSSTANTKQTEINMDTNDNSTAQHLSELVDERNI